MTEFSVTSKDVPSEVMAKVANFVNSLVSRLMPKAHDQKYPDVTRRQRRLAVVSWFSTSDLDTLDDGSTFLLDDGICDVMSASSGRPRDSGYRGRYSRKDIHNRPLTWVLEDKIYIDLERGEVITTLLPESAASEVRRDQDLGLLRCTSIQDRCLKVTHKRRQNLAKKNPRRKYSSFKRAIFPDEGIDGKSEDSSVTDQSSDEALSSPCQKKSQLADVSIEESPESTYVQGIRYDVIARQSSVQKKSWEIRRRRKQEVQKKRRSVHLEYFRESYIL